MIPTVNVYPPPGWSPEKPIIIIEGKVVRYVKGELIQEFSSILGKDICTLRLWLPRRSPVALTRPYVEYRIDGFAWRSNFEDIVVGTKIPTRQRMILCFDDVVLKYKGSVAIQPEEL